MTILKIKQWLRKPQFKWIEDERLAIRLSDGRRFMLGMNALTNKGVGPIVFFCEDGIHVRVGINYGFGNPADFLKQFDFEINEID